MVVATLTPREQTVSPFFVAVLVAVFVVCSVVVVVGVVVVAIRRSSLHCYLSPPLLIDNAAAAAAAVTLTPVMTPAEIVAILQNSKHCLYPQHLPDSNFPPSIPALRLLAADWQNNQLLLLLLLVVCWARATGAPVSFFLLLLVNYSPAGPQPSSLKRMLPKIVDAAVVVAA